MLPTPSTPGLLSGSRKVFPVLVAGALMSCNGAPARADNQPEPLKKAPATPAPEQGPESSLGVSDTGIWSDLDGRVQLALPPDLGPGDVTGLVDEGRDLLILYVGDWPTKVYPLRGSAKLAVGDRTLDLRPGDRRELAPLLRPARLGLLEPGQPAAPGDRDGDGIPDPLDLLIGAHKTALNAASYGAGYLALDYPMGDVPRQAGVCTDVIVRALRNAGLDLQADLHRDIRRAGAAYPMVKGRGDPNIDHRRVKTLLPYFQRHGSRRSAALDDPDDPLRPGDIVFLDTFPSRSGPDHIGIISDRRAPSGLPYVINNWTDGTVTEEMDLLGWVPVLERFRL